MIWTEKHDDMLRRLRAEGVSVSQISINIYQMTGDYFSRGAVASRSNRIGAACPQRERSVPKPRAEPKAKIKVTAVEHLPPPASALGLRSESVHKMGIGDPWVALPESRSITINEIREGDCRWPLWDDGDEPNKRYCGAACKAGSSWCQPHADLARGERRNVA